MEPTTGKAIISRNHEDFSDGFCLLVLAMSINAQNQSTRVSIMSVIAISILLEFKLYVLFST